MSAAVANSSFQFVELHSDQDIERLLLASAGAIQRLIAERNALRSKVGVQEPSSNGFVTNLALFTTATED